MTDSGTETTAEVWFSKDDTLKLILMLTGQEVKSLFEVKEDGREEEVSDGQVSKRKEEYFLSWLMTDKDGTLNSNLGSETILSLRLK